MVAEGMSDFRHLRLGWNRKRGLIPRVDGIELGHFLLGHRFGGTSIHPGGLQVGHEVGFESSIMAVVRVSGKDMGVRS